MICVALAACGDASDGGAGGAPFGGGNPPAASGGSGKHHPQARGAPYRVPNYGANVFGLDLADPVDWAGVRAWFLKSCPDGRECVQLVRRYRESPGSVAGCKFLDTSPGSGGRLEYGQTLVVWGTKPCPDPNKPSPEESPPVETSPGDSPPVGSPAPEEDDASPPSRP
jgi:hypothetical protein